jgi:hypothetical protein
VYIWEDVDTPLAFEVESFDRHQREDGRLYWSAVVRGKTERVGADSLFGSWQIYEVVGQDEQLTIDPGFIGDRRECNPILAKALVKRMRNEEKSLTSPKQKKTPTLD